MPEFISMAAISIANFRKNGITFQIFKVFHNDGCPLKQQQVVYQPLFFLKSSSESGQIFTQRELLPNGGVRIILKLILDDENAQVALPTRSQKYCKMRLPKW